MIAFLFGFILGVVFAVGIFAYKPTLFEQLRYLFMRWFG